MDINGVVPSESKPVREMYDSDAELVTRIRIKMRYILNTQTLDLFDLAAGRIETLSKELFALRQTLMVNNGNLPTRKD